MAPVPSHLVGWMTPKGVSEEGTTVEGDVRCPCGSERLEFHSAGTCQGAPELRMDLAVRAVCVACGQGHVLFDSGLHGWDVVCYGHRRASSLPFRPWRCPQCGEAAHRGTVRFTVVPDERSVIRYSA